MVTAGSPKSLSVIAFALKTHGAGDGNRTRVLSLGSCKELEGLVYKMTDQKYFYYSQISRIKTTGILRAYVIGVMCDNSNFSIVRLSGWCVSIRDDPRWR